ncbi:MAG: TRAP-type C4-dicarboxylate transport system permease small subunit [Clostridium sp.]|jgi:TRAP-type C4-dicarboxylate transport system permease small subunit
MKNVSKFINILRDIIEVYTPMLTFAVMFFVFIVQIFSRYAFDYPLTWSYEVTVIGFSWTVILGACYAMRTDNHVKFTLIYDLLSAKKAALLRLLGNLIIVVSFILLIVPSANYVVFMNFQSTAVLKVKLSWIFAPFVYFLISIVMYTINEVIEDVKILISSKYDPELKDERGTK